jgi:hypothetical protein
MIYEAPVPDLTNPNPFPFMGRNTGKRVRSVLDRYFTLARQSMALDYSMFLSVDLWGVETWLPVDLGEPKELMGLQSILDDEDWL